MRWKCDVDGKGTNNIGKDFLKRAAIGEPNRTAIGYEATGGHRAILQFVRYTQGERTVWVVHCTVSAKKAVAPQVLIVRPLLTADGITSVVESALTSVDVKQTHAPCSDAFLNLFQEYGIVVAT